MITIITEMTNAELFKNYWMPLICKYREFNFIFAKTEGLQYPAMRDWSNVKFAKTQSAEEVIKHADKGGLVLGICNGFQILIEAGLLPGVLLRNKKLRIISKNVFLKVTNIQNHFCKDYKNKNIIKLPIAHNEGNYFASD